MKIPSRRGSVAVGASLAAMGLSAAVLLALSRGAATPAGRCDGAYADGLQGQSARTRAIEQGAPGGWSYLVRSSASYECPLFGPDGKLRRRRIEATEHGTAFAYEANAHETFLLTNEHVAAWPDVTDGAHKVDGVPEGCKRVEERIRIVDDVKDEDDPAHLMLARIAVDPALDVAILRAPKKLAALPYKIGRSSALRQGNAVQVRGFPLGLLAAVNVGKVVNPYDRDQEQGWDHVDFVIDALLGEGNSGSPVLALSCASGAFELVGVYHAGYKGHSALNVVVGIDQLREIMLKKRRVPHGPAVDPLGPAAAVAQRERLRELLATDTLPFLDFGGLTARVEARPDGALLYDVYGRQFPLDDRRAAVLEDRAADPVTVSTAAASGEAGRLWVRGDLGWREWSPVALGVEERDLVARAVRALRLQAARTFEYRAALAHPASADERRRSRDIKREIGRNEAPLRDLSGALLELTDRLGPGRESLVSSVSEPPPTTGVAPGSGVPALR